MRMLGSWVLVERGDAEAAYQGQALSKKEGKDKMDVDGKELVNDTSVS